MNSVAGGGSLITFPVLVWLGRDPIIANATNTVSLLPGSIAALHGFRHELRGLGRWIVWGTSPSIVGGVAGAALLLRTPSPVFAWLVPYLILFANAGGGGPGNGNGTGTGTGTGTGAVVSTQSTKPENGSTKSSNGDKPKGDEVLQVEVLPRGGIARFYGTAKIYKSGPVYEEVWRRLIQPEKDRDPDKKGYAVLIAVERAEDLAGQPLTLD